jgi:hypothetical protein
MKAALDIALRALIIAPVPQSEISANDCLTRSYYGTYGGQSVFIPQNDCQVPQFQNGGYLSVIPVNTNELVWIQQMAVDSKVAGGHELEWESGKHWDIMDNALRTELSVLRSHIVGGLDEELGQMSFDVMGDLADESDLEVLYRTPQASLIAFRHFNAAALHIDQHLPPFFKPYVLPSSPTSGIVPVPSEDVKRVQSLLTHLKHDAIIDEIVQNISVSQMKKDIAWLTGEDERSGIQSRHSFSKGARVAAKWISDRMEETGAQCDLRPFLYGFAPNILW